MIGQKVIALIIRSMLFLYFYLSILFLLLALNITVILLIFYKKGRTIKKQIE